MRRVLGIMGLVAASACDIVPNPTLAQLLDGGPHGASATVQRDIAYGADTGCFLTDEMCGGSQELDVHRSAVGDARRPVVVWIRIMPPAGNASWTSATFVTVGVAVPSAGFQPKSCWMACHVVSGLMSSVSWLPPGRTVMPGYSLEVR